MKIQYKVTITNPIKESLIVTNDLDQEGKFTVKKNKHGINISGGLIVENKEIKAYNSSYRGETYSLNEVDELVLGNEDYFLADIENIFDCLGKNVNSEEFLLVQKDLKLARNNTIQHFVEKSSDVFLIEISSTGLITKFDGIVKEFSNKIIANTPLPETSVLGYFLISKPLKLDTDNSMFISNNDLLKIPFGFCTISNFISNKNTSELVLKTDFLEFFSSVKDTLSFSSYILIDGVKTSQYKIRENEKIIIELDDGYSDLTFNNVTNNITLIYKVTETNVVEPYIAVVDLDIDVPSSDILVQYQELLTADEEFLKRYLIQEYKVTLNTTHNEYNIINSDVLKTLTETSAFEGKILKI